MKITLKKALYLLTVILILGATCYSCAIDKKCPAYSKAKTTNLEKSV